VNFIAANSQEDGGFSLRGYVTKSTKAASLAPHYYIGIALRMNRRFTESDIPLYFSTVFKYLKGCRISIRKLHIIQWKNIYSSVSEY
jgi:hypothetical protein